MRPKRDDRRFVVNQPARLLTPDRPAEEWPARICDISRRGMQFVLDRPLTPGQHVRILWGGCEIHGIIRYQQRHGNEHRLGVELSSSGDSLVSDVLAQQAEELRVSNAALKRAEQHLVATAEALKKTNQELAVALDLAREASQAKSRFLASVSHELRTPLNGIIGFSQLLHDGALGQLTAEQKSGLADVLQCSDYLLTLISQVLDLTQIESGKMDFHYEVISLREVVGSAIDSLRTIATSKQLNFSLRVDPGTDRVQADPARLRQVVLNYLSNALKFTPLNGSIVVDVRSEDSRHYRISVTDTGVGIKSSDFPRLFVEFGQLGGSEKAHEGTGLGLVITRRIVEAQGGRVGVESVPGKGSCFYAVLPASVPIP
jgi:signal transduction histidine kinase